MCFARETGIIPPMFHATTATKDYATAATYEALREPVFSIMKGRGWQVVHEKLYSVCSLKDKGIIPSGDSLSSKVLLP